MKNKKGFTMVELLATITILGILSALAVVSVSSYLSKARKDAYTDYETSLEQSTENALVENSKLIPAINASTVVDAKWLICHGYSKELKDPKDNKKNCQEESYVIITRNTDVGFNMDVTYQVCLKCSGYQSEACMTSISGIPRLSVNENCEE